MPYREQLKKIQSDLETKRAMLSAEMEALPEGSLHILRRGEKEYYSERLPKKGNRKKERRYGISGDPEKVRLLVRKKYIQGALKAIDKDIRILSGAIRKYQNNDETSVMKGFAAGHPDLAAFIYKDTSDLDEWAANYVQQEDFYEEGKTSVTSDGKSMRSRGEIAVAEKLRENNIPFRYEGSLEMPDLPFVPDFTIKRPRDGKIFFWEHIGDVNDRAYMERNARKFEEYERYGIVPWDNLIITYDFANGGLNLPLIEGMIRAWLL